MKLVQLRIVKKKKLFKRNLLMIVKRWLVKRIAKKKKLHKFLKKLEKLKMNVHKKLMVELQTVVTLDQVVVMAQFLAEVGMVLQRNGSRRRSMHNNKK